MKATHDTTSDDESDLLIPRMDVLINLRSSSIDDIISCADVSAP